MVVHICSDHIFIGVNDDLSLGIDNINIPGSGNLLGEENVSGPQLRFFSSEYSGVVLPVEILNDILILFCQGAEIAAGRECGRGFDDLTNIDNGMIEVFFQTLGENILHKDIEYPGPEEEQRK